MALKLITDRARAAKGARGVATLVRRAPLGIVGGALVVVFAVGAFGAEWIAPYDPLEFHYDSPFSPPGPAFLLGTDNFGRDVLSRVMWGARTSLYVGIGAAMLGQVGGGMLGVFTAYLGGKVDLIIQRGVDVMMVFPPLVLTLTIVATLGSSLENVMVAIALAQAPSAVRTIRAAGLGAKEALYVEAARAVGCSGVRIVLRHIFPDVVAPLLIILTASLGTAILQEASLSFLGLGVPPPQPSWGAMMSGEGRGHLVQAPWIALSAGIALSLVVLGFNLVGDTLRDLWDPRLRHQ